MCLDVSTLGHGIWSAIDLGNMTDVLMVTWLLKTCKHSLLGSTVAFFFVCLVLLLSLLMVLMAPECFTTHRRLSLFIF